MQYNLYKDNKFLKSFNNEHKLLEHILNIQPFSMDYALKWGGYKVKESELNNEKL